LEQIEQFITSKLQSYECHDFLILSCNKLKTDTRDFLHSNLSPEYFDKLIKLENTLEEAAKIVGQDFVVQMPSTFNQTTTVETINVNEMAIGILKLVNKPSAKILLSIVEAFTINITWEEFYFLCKIFELYDEISKVAKNTVFSSVYDNFVTLDNKYPDYSHEYITKYKMRLLNYKGSQKKKYVLLFKVREVDTVVVTTELMSLLLDFVVIDGAIYIHHSYFNGFANLEIMFGNYITV